MKLFDRQVNRLFTFGCSFTKYHWTTWPEIVAYELQVPLYNYGRSGAGNQYIANMISQADAIHHFDENDLIMISWTNVCREDRYRNKNWVTPGNIFTQNLYSKEHVKEWADPIGYMLRDLCSIKLTLNFLENKKSQFHMLPMCDIINVVDQCQNENESDEILKKTIKDMYQPVLDRMHLDFFNVLWQNDLQINKFPKDIIEISPYFNDGHPTPIEHYQYLEHIFPNSFNKKTLDAIKEKQNFFVEFMKRMAANYQRVFTVYELNDENSQILTQGTTLVKSQAVSFV